VPDLSKLCVRALLAYQADAIFLLCSAATQPWDQPAKLLDHQPPRKEAKENERAAGMFLLQEIFGPTDTVCGIVMPLSSSPPQGVTLMLRILSGTPRLRLSSC